MEGFPQLALLLQYRLPDVLTSIIPVSLLNFLESNMKLFNLKLLFLSFKKNEWGVKINHMRETYSDLMK